MGSRWTFVYTYIYTAHLRHKKLLTGRMKGYAIMRNQSTVKSIIGEGHIFIYSCSAKLIHFETRF